MSKKLALLFIFSALFFAERSSAQIDLNNLDLKDIIGKVMYVQKGFAPKFTLGRTPIQKISKVEEILGLKQNAEINRLFRTFKTGRIIYKVGAYAGGAIAVYSLVRKTENSVKSQDYNTALYSGISAIGTGLIIKFLTKGASYKAVDIFNGIAVKKIKDIFSIGPASNTAGVGLYVKL
ncbi:MAG TPA: hypothetical protein VFT78_14570 [Hanamia sp.]|jgi:hypothetical protein|nr:hypothetical protein [Hanamia sp.]